MFYLVGEENVVGVVFMVWIDLRIVNEVYGIVFIFGEVVKSEGFKVELVMVMVFDYKCSWWFY